MDHVAEARLTKSLSRSHLLAARNWKAYVFSSSSLLVLLVATSAASLFVGAYPLSGEEVLHALAHPFLGERVALANESLVYLIWQIRLPRVVLGLLVGAGLASAGAAIQGMFRNPLADPALIGVTSGAMVFAVAGVVFSSALLGAFSALLGYALVTVLAFVGSVSTTFLVYRLATHRGKTSVPTMLLAGIAITALGGALTGLMTYFSTEDELRDITFWTLGSVGGANWKLLAFVAPSVLMAFTLLLRQSRKLDILLLGEREAQYLGVNTQRTKWIIIGAAALAVGSCVAASGVIAFVALVVPHLVRLIHGSGHRKLLMCSALLGGVLMVGADAVARVIIAPAELPIGILTSLLGAPFFIWLLLSARNQRSAFL